MSGFGRLNVGGELHFLCTLNISNDCEGYVPLRKLYVDTKGDVWNCCRPCGEEDHK